MSNRIKLKLFSQQLP